MPNQSHVHKSLVATLLDQVEARPQMPVYRFEHSNGEVEVLTPAALDTRARKIAGALLNLSPRPGTAVLLHQTGPEFICSFFGCLYAGVIAVPAASQRLNADSIRRLLTDCSSSLIITSASFRYRIQQRLVQDKSGIVLLTEKDCDPFELREPVDLESRRISYLQYTSGSTSTPKGVMISDENVLSNLDYIEEDFRHDESSVSVTWLPHFHDMGLVYGLLAPLYHGFQCIVLAPADFAKSPMLWLQAISQHHATHSGGPDFAYALCTKRLTPEARETLDLSSWRVAFNGAEPVRMQTILGFSETFASCGFRRSAFYPAFGLAEATLKVSGGFMDASQRTSSGVHGLQKNQPLTPGDFHEEQVVVSCGQPGTSVSVEIVNPETCRRVAAGGVGEIWVSGASVGHGYWNCPSETLRTFQAVLANDNSGPFLRTGDLGVLVNGELFVTGRLKELMIIYGENYYPQDVEDTVSEASPETVGHTIVAFTLVRQGIERAIVICEVNKRQERLNFSRLAETIRAAVTLKHGIPLYSVVFAKTGSLHRTSSGKLQRSRASADYLSGNLPMLEQSLLSESNTLPRADIAETYTTLEQRLINIISRLLGRSLTAREVASALCVLGIDSLQAQELQGKLEAEFGQTFPVESLLSGASIASLAEKLRSGKPALVQERWLDQGLEKGLMPLSPEQERLWFIWLLVPKSTAQNLTVAFRLKGLLQFERWKAAIAETYRRHDPLRTTFLHASGVPYRQIHPFLGFDLHFVDLSSMAPALREGEARHHIEATSYKPFDLERDPMLRSILVKLSAEDHIAVFVTHHIVSDVWSVDVLLREVSSNYCKTDRDIAAPTQGSYEDHIADLNHWLWGTKVTEHRKFWEAQLKDAPTVAMLPCCEYQRLKRDPHKAHEVTIEVPQAVRGQLEQLAKMEGVTMFVALLSAFYVFLHVITKQKDMVIGIPVAGRTKPEHRNIIGLFAHPVPLRVQLTGQETFRDLLRSVRARLLPVLDHQMLPFSKVVEAIAPNRTSTRTPLFNVMFGFHGCLIENLDLDGLALERYSVPRTASDFDLFINFENCSTLLMSLTYDTALFTPLTADELMRGYVALLDQFSAMPSALISDTVQFEGKAQDNGHVTQEQSV